MEREAYHHGDLRNDLIRAGLKLLNEEGYEQLSLRKVAKYCGVSHTAPYRHFKSKEELVAVISLETVRKFNSVLRQAVDLYPGDYRQQLLEMGYLYVKFFVENPDYLRLLFLNDAKAYAGLAMPLLEEQELPFKTFYTCVQNLLSQRQSQEDVHTVALGNWSLVHGLAILIVRQDYPYEGNYLELARRIVKERLVYLL